MSGVNAIALYGIYHGKYRLFDVKPHSSTRPTKQRKNIQKWAESVHWMGLVILSTHAGEASDDYGFVEFRALYLEAGKMQQIHEKSLFKRENQKWVYVSGEHF